MADLKQYIGKIATGDALSAEEAHQAFNIIMSGQATPSQTGALLMGLRVRGETVGEITGAVTTMRAKMLPVDAPGDAIDIVGTGGDASGSYNVSTLSAIIVAGTGLPVAKHGNRALSSKSGAADTLAALGVNIEASAQTISACIRKAGVGFMFAPAHHAAMRHVGPARVELGTRTIFNLLGPLSNPASVTRQLVGVFAPQWVEPLAHVLKELGSKSAWVVHGDGMDEMTTTGITRVAQLKDGTVTTFELTPQDAGLSQVDFEQLKGGDAAHNAKALTAVLDGEPNAYRDIALLNSAGALVMAEKAADLTDGVRIAADALDNGAAKSVLAKLVEISNRDDQADQ